jgi:hypothetical protein
MESHARERRLGILVSGRGKPSALVVDTPTSGEKQKYPLLLIILVTGKEGFKNKIST